METRILSAPGLDFWVEVRLVGHDGRWIAVASIAGDPELGWGPTTQAAVRMALSSLGPVTADMGTSPRTATNLPADGR
ncbi:MAG: hypothetical protein ACRDGB_11385 [Candidatus Limnocylindria bacterium]